MSDRDIDTCDLQCIHEETVNKVRKALLSEETIMDLQNLYKVLGDGTRLSIMNALSLAEMCVCDVAAALGMSQSAVSHQLRVLKAARLVKYRREGKQVYYSLDDDHITQLLAVGLEHVRHQ
ncbi:MAG TPA: metalloregulator ArsR/SmtB family transcription factor [Candidatus Atribacteria bacterium]|nr:metalloregulator ArsR/SmtB family transcription factor [Candidatus Atribacteria bacterium]HPT79087.1 metalloregulator ArsR/SmtB family transcription factor [Candidatus Atribacteria bacterium]